MNGMLEAMEKAGIVTRQQANKERFAKKKQAYDEHQWSKIEKKRAEQLSENKQDSDQDDQTTV